VGVEAAPPPNGQLEPAEKCWQALFGDLFLYCCFRRISSLSLQLLAHISTNTGFSDVLFCTRMWDEFLANGMQLSLYTNKIWGGPNVVKQNILHQ